MSATAMLPAEVEHARRVRAANDLDADALPLQEEGDVLAPARGIVLGMALGAASLLALGSLIWWVV